eukprot:CAMPEP_0183827938 /NCGR_PEP_ID=MMETSP0807_2-20130328/2515_1 /TAXON_ID=88271 /ORGANISM="Picocystis salinarum, Strain CCMP1897" /LENGTH=310 /DNA_ID=CAMNT_0026073117 /DNA_START=26 /DNA_END=958 /DNA_ORIENTATION=-
MAPTATNAPKATREEEEQREVSERRLRQAKKRGVLSESRLRVPEERPASSPLLQSHGFDVVKKSTNRKQRYLMVFPGQMAPAGVGEMGQMDQLDTQNPVLYLHFPQGRLKLLGTLVYPKNKYMALSIGRRKVMCEDVFESLVVFCDSYWIGTAEENPEETPMPMPRELENRTHEKYTFHGGASRKPTSDTGEEGTQKSQEDEDEQDLEDEFPTQTMPSSERQSKHSASKTRRSIITVDDDCKGDGPEEEGDNKVIVTRPRLKRHKATSPVGTKSAVNAASIGNPEVSEDDPFAGISDEDTEGEEDPDFKA